jgi:arylsulfatase A-like enzyme
MMSGRSGLSWAMVVALACAIGYMEPRGESPGALAAGARAQQPGQDDGGSVLPRSPEPFRGRIDLRAKDSKSDFPVPVHAPAGAPNILLVLLDDVGFGAASTFGGPCNTPTAQRLAANGLRYNRFHTTALCSPTRAALLTGRNHHSVHTGCIMEGGTGFPGYDTLMGKDTATVAEILKQSGYNTSWYGKNHNVPDWHTSQNGPFDLWPNGLGFEHFYGFIGGDTSQWRPNSYEGTKPIEPYVGKPDYNLDYDLADQAIKWIRAQKSISPDRPFFAYYAPGATHAPHHPRKEWIAKYKGKFDQGWDKVREETFARQKAIGVIPADAKLTERPKEIPAWDTLSAEQRSVYARMMEIYAAYLEQTDFNVGRVVDAIEQTGQLDNTLVIYIVGDNGASAEGSMQGLLNELTFFNGVPEDLKEVLAHVDDLGTWKTYNHYPVGWAHAMCTPFQWTKQVASHFGGTRNGMVISWPKRIKDKGGLRSQFHHVIDIAPTLLEAAGIGAPSSVNGAEQKPIEGVSMVYTFDDAAAAPRRTTQYFEMLGNRGIYHDGWVACTTPPIAPWEPNSANVDPITGYRWELYNVAKDFSEADDVAASAPEVLKDMQIRFYAEAAKYDVLPIDNSRTARMDPANRPSLTHGRKSFTFFEGMTRVPEGASPDMKNKSFSITALVEVTDGNASGMIITQGGYFGGYGLYLEKGKPIFHYNFVGVARYRLGANDAVAPGKHSVKVDFTFDGGGMGKGGGAMLSVDGNTVAQGRIEHTIPVRVSLDESLDVGEDTGTPLDDSYDVPFRFTGKIEKVTIELK